MTPERIGPGALGGATEAGIKNARQGIDTPLTRQARAPGAHIVLRHWRPRRRTTLRGFADIELFDGLQIDHIAVHVRGGRAWASLPARQALEDGRRVIRDGKLAYTRILAWGGRDLADRFSTAVVELVRRTHPDALEDAGP